MLFSEIYSTYYTAMAKLIASAIDGKLTDANAGEIISSAAFEESFVYILEHIKSEEWQIVSKNFKTPIKHYPKMPITTLQKSFLKSIQLDSRFKLFGNEINGLDDVSPLYFQDDFYCFDKIKDGDDYDDEQYIANFKVILQALKENRKLTINFCGGKGFIQKGVYTPRKLEFSEKDDKFRLICLGNYNVATINLGRIISCEIGEHYDCGKIAPYTRKLEVVELQIINKRNALERCLLNFSYLKKKTRQIDNNNYQMKLYYHKDDETEILIRILSFGPMIKVLAPTSFIKLVLDRLNNQKSCE